MIEAGPEAVGTLADLLGARRRILIFTGAGISTASGIPDFRGPQGIWKSRTPVYYQDFLSSEDERRRYWQQKLEDRESFGRAEPNAVHRAIARIEQAGAVEMLVTQNVDGLHRAAGANLERLVEIHGTNAEVECQSCGELSDPVQHFAEFVATGAAPVCHCGGFLKPATISFGQSLRHDDLQRSLAAAERSDLVLALGSTMAVEPAASIPLVALRRGVPYVIVNRGPTEHDSLAGLTLRIEGDVGDVVPQAVDEAFG
jgi:NAD-dependent deacetylase